MCNNKFDPAGIFLELGSPLYGLQGFAKNIFENDEIYKDMPPEVVAWLEKWAPKFDVWVTEFEKLRHLPKGNLTLDQRYKTLIQKLIFVLDGVEAAAIEVNAVPIPKILDDKYHFKALKSAIWYIEETYQRMNEYIASLE